MATHFKCFSFSSIANGGEGRDEEALIFQVQIPQ